MRDLPDRALRALLSFALCLALAACGPGSGGTGTGPTSQLFSASTVAGSTTGGVLVPGGNTTVRIDLQLQNTSVELTTDCGRFVFIGDWAANAGSTVVLPGRFETSTTSTVANLRLQFSDGPSDSRQVTVTLLDSGGGVLLGPIALNRTDSLPARLATGCN